MSSNYKLLSYLAPDGTSRSGILIDDNVYDAQQVLQSRAPSLTLRSTDAMALLGAWPAVHPALTAFASRIAALGGASKATTSAMPLSQTRLLAPLLYPGGIYCVGANYRDHTREMAAVSGRPQPKDPRTNGAKPWHFIKTGPASVIGPDSVFRLPSHSKTVDWEAELAVVIGKPCKDVAPGDAMDYVAGFTILNDLSARDHLKRAGAPPESPFLFDWVSHKCFDDSCPMGPWIVPRDQIPDPSNLSIRLWVNDELMQDSNSSEMIFSIEEQIAHLSSRFTLLPGDVLGTGTPAGVGMARGVFLKTGDVVRIDIENIGTLTNTAACN